MKHNALVITLFTSLSLLASHAFAYSGEHIRTFGDLTHTFVESKPVIATLFINKCLLDEGSKSMPSFFDMQGLKRFNANGGYANTGDSGINTIHFFTVQQLLVDQSLPIATTYNSYSLISELIFKEDRSIHYLARLTEPLKNQKTFTSSYTCPWSAVIFN